MSIRRFLIDWIAVSIIRTVQVTFALWLLIAIAAYSDLEFLGGWRDFVIPLIWLSGISFAVVLATRRHELADFFE